MHDSNDESIRYNNSCTQTQYSKKEEFRMFLANVPRMQMSDRNYNFQRERRLSNAQKTTGRMSPMHLENKTQKAAEEKQLLLDVNNVPSNGSLQRDSGGSPQSNGIAAPAVK